MVQMHRFHNGGFVLHKIMLNGRKYSAWYTANGALLNAERVQGARGTCSVPLSHTGVRKELERIGGYYVRAAPLKF